VQVALGRARGQAGALLRSEPEYSGELGDKGPRDLFLPKWIRSIREPKYSFSNWPLSRDGLKSVEVLPNSSKSLNVVSGTALLFSVEDRRKV
jgi:hypothetical protein